MEAFFALHSGLHREGPGTAADVAWVAAAARTPRDAAICDAACGPGGDIAALRDAAPDGTVLAFDKHLAFVADAARRHRRDPGVTATDGLLIGDGDPLERGPFDLIWCAGAMYFEGVGPCLRHWRRALSPGGAVAFSHPTHFAAPDADVEAFWEGEEVGDEDALDAEIHAAGYGVLARSRVAPEGWEAYYAGLEARCDELAACASSAIRVSVAEARAEAAAWCRVADRTGYALRVVRPT